MTEFFTLPASNDAVPYSPKWLNALSDAEKQSVAMSDFSRSMHNSGGEHVAWLLWSTQEKAKPTPLEYRQGSMFFLDCGRGPFAVTAGHVFEQFAKDRAELRVRDGRWPPPPNVDEVVYFGGFPGHERIEVASREFSFGLHSGMVAADRHDRVPALLPV